jgi:hypothetical protein
MVLTDQLLCMHLLSHHHLLVRCNVLVCCAARSFSGQAVCFGLVGAPGTQGPPAWAILCASLAVVVVGTWDGQPPSGAVGGEPCLEMWIVYRGHKFFAASIWWSLNLITAPLIESEKATKIANWKACQLAH